MSETLQRPRTATPVEPAWPATGAAVRVLGLVVSLAAAEHGVGEIVRRDSVAEGPMIESWPGVAAFEQLSYEPAMTVLDQPVAAGAATIVLAALLAVVAVRNDRAPHAGPAIAVLSLALLLTGGGLAPPLIGGLLAITWWVSRRQHAQAPGPVRRRLAHQWPGLLVVTTAAYLALFPGTVLMHWWFGTSSAVLVAGLGLTAFAGLSATLVAAVAADRELAGYGVRPTRAARSRHHDSRSTRPS